MSLIERSTAPSSGATKPRNEGDEFDGDVSGSAGTASDATDTDEPACRPIHMLTNDYFHFWAAASSTCPRQQQAGYGLQISMQQPLLRACHARYALCMKMAHRAWHAQEYTDGHADRMDPSRKKMAGTSVGLHASKASAWSATAAQLTEHGTVPGPWL